MDAVRALADEIGPRPACSSAERRAALWASARLADLGYEVSEQTFPSRPSYAPWFMAYFSLAFAGAVASTFIPGPAFVLALIGITLYARDADGRPLIEARGGESVNVVARSGSYTEPVVVVMAHLDSARSSPPFHPSLVGKVRGTAVVLNTSLFLTVLIAAAVWFLGTDIENILTVRLITFALSLYLLLVIVLLALGLRMPLVAGANDDASGVEVLMRVAEEKVNRPVWFVLTGSEEVGMIGARRFSEEHPEARGATVVNVDSVGIGSLIAASAEGILRERRPPGYLLDLAEAAGAEPRPFRGMPTDATALLARGHRAISLLAVDDRGVIPHWHWTSDVTSNLDISSLDRTAIVAGALVDALLEESAGSVPG